MVESAAHKVMSGTLCTVGYSYQLKDMTVSSVFQILMNGLRSLYILTHLLGDSVVFGEIRAVAKAVTSAVQCVWV